MKPSTQTEAIKIALANGTKLSSLNSFKEVGCMRLSARMFDVTDEGWILNKEWKETKTRYGTRCRYMEYSLNKSTQKSLWGKYVSKYEYFEQVSKDRFVMK
jgi:hypothetical protein